MTGRLCPGGGGFRPEGLCSVAGLGICRLPERGQGPANSAISGYYRTHYPTGLAAGGVFFNFEILSGTKKPIMKVCYFCMKNSDLQTPQ